MDKKLYKNNRKSIRKVGTYVQVNNNKIPLSYSGVYKDESEKKSSNRILIFFGLEPKLKNCRNYYARYL